MSDYNRETSLYGSDSFESDGDYKKKRSPRKKLNSQPVINRNYQIYKDYKPTAINAKNRQRNNNKKFIQQRRFNAAELDVTVQRILSARKHKICDQNNSIQELQKLIEDLQSENRTLRSQSYRQEKELIKIDSKQSDLPRILEQHQSEMLNLKEQLKRTKELLNNEMKQRKDSDTEILKLRSSLSKANQLVSDRNLGERSVLQMQLIEAQEKLENSEKSIEVLHKHLEMLEKSHKREVVGLKKNIRQFESQHLDLQKELEQLKINLKEKEKLLEIQNIYSHRIKIPHRLPSSSNDHHTCGFCSGPQSEQLLDKLHFNNINGKESNPNKINSQVNSNEDNNLKYLDPEKIKEDIRKILEEEILSGRIKPIEYTANDNLAVISNTTPHGYLPEVTSPVPDSYNTSRTVNSCIFDKDPPTQVESVVEDTPRVEENIEQLERNLEQKQILLNKLSEIDNKNFQIELKEKSDLQYKYPNDKDYVENDPVISEIETIITSEVKKPSKTYKFNDIIENLHHGVPAHFNNVDSNYRHRVPDTKRTNISVKNDSVNLQTEAAFGQKNNSNSDQSKDEYLPPLTEAEKQQKERELMSELFGKTPTSGSYKNRTVNLPWDKENSNHNMSYNSPTKPRFIELNKSEELEEILL